MHGLIDYTEIEVTDEDLEKELLELSIPMKDEKSPSFRLTLIEMVQGEKRSKQDAWEIYSSCNSDLKREEVQLFKWHGHASEKKFLDDRAGYLVKVRGLIVFSKLLMLS